MYPKFLCGRVRQTQILYTLFSIVKVLLSIPKCCIIFVEFELKFMLVGGNITEIFCVALKNMYKGYAS